MQTVTALSARKMVSEIKEGRISACELTGAHLERIEKINPTVNSICTLNPDALADAQDVDKRLADGEPSRPLEGVPYLVKDCILTKGLRTTFGSRLLDDFVPEEDSVVVERMRLAGAVLIGKTNTPEFTHDVNTTNFLFGTTRNPWNLDFTVGGSSGGSAASVTANLSPLAIGTDLGGSIREPSAFTGIVGIRPSFGLVPNYPVDLPWGTLVTAVVGPMARHVSDAALMLSVFAGPDDRDPTTLPAQGIDLGEVAERKIDLKGRRIAYAGDLNGLVPQDPDVRELGRVAAQRFATLGCDVVDDCFDTSVLLDIVVGSRAFGMVGNYADRYDAHKDLMTPAMVNQIEASLKVDLRTVTNAERQRGVYWQSVRQFLERYDYILTAAIGVPPFRLNHPLPTEIGGKKVTRYYDAYLSTYAFSITGLPVISLPAGLTREGLPVGIQIVGPRFRDDRVIEAGVAYEDTFPELFCTPEIDTSKATGIEPGGPSKDNVMVRPQ
jgi:amidase